TGGARARGVELATAVVSEFVAVGGNEDVPAPVDGHAKGVPPPAIAAPRREEGAPVVELLDVVVAIVANEDVPAPVDGHAQGEVELSRPAATAAPRREEGAAGSD